MSASVHLYNNNSTNLLHDIDLDSNQPLHSRPPVIGQELDQNVDLILSCSSSEPTTSSNSMSLPGTQETPPGTAGMPGPNPDSASDPPPETGPSGPSDPTSVPEKSSDSDIKKPELPETGPRTPPAIAPKPKLKEVISNSSGSNGGSTKVSDNPTLEPLVQRQAEVTSPKVNSSCSFDDPHYKCISNFRLS